MADIADETKKDTAWTGGTPPVRLESDTLPENPQRVIRTYASDLAALKGIPAGANTSPAPKVVAPKPPPLPPPMYVRKPESVPPPIPLSKAVAQSWEEPVVYEKKPSFLSRFFSFFFEKSEASAQRPAPILAQEPPPPAPVAPSEPPLAEVLDLEPSIASAVPSLSATQEAASREEILARLRARVAEYQSANPTLPPVFPTPKPESVPATPRPATWTPPSFTSAGAASEPDRLRTFSSDFGDEAKREGASRISVYAAQADAPRAPVPVQKPHRGLAYALAAAVLFVGGSLALYFAYSYFAAKGPVPILSSAPPALIAGDESTAISGSGADLMSALASAGGGALPVGTVRVIYLSVSTTTPTGTMQIEKPGGDLIAELRLPAPSILLRNVGENSTVGVLHAGEDTRVFFILAANSYERTFAGMLSWEASIGRDLGALYPPYTTALVQATSTATTTAATTTPAAPPPAPMPPHFVDEVVESHDVRALKDDQGRTLLLYGYRDQRTLVIARDETAFSVLLARLSATQ